MILYLLFLLLAIGVLVRELLKWKNRFSEPGIPIKGPRPMPFIGNIPEARGFGKKRLQIMLEYQRKYGPVFRFWGMPFIGTGRNTFLATPEAAEQVLKSDFPNFPLSETRALFFDKLIGDGIFTSNGELWQFQRKTASHIFKSRNLKTFMFDVFAEHSDQLTDYVARQGDVPIDACDLFYRFTLDSIVRIAFGAELGSLKDGVTSEISRAFDVAQDETALRAKNWNWVLFRKDVAALDEAVGTLNAFAAKLTKERRQEGESGQQDLLSRYVFQTDMDDMAIRDMVMSFLIAGRDTTGTTLSWLFASLSENPEAYNKLLEEIDAFGGELPTFDDLKPSVMPYLNGCIQEALRLYPAVPIDGKLAKEDVLIDGKYFCPGGDIVFWSAWLMGRNPDYWADPDCFRPERWLRGGEAEGQHPYLHIPFQAGPRICLGKEMAMEEMRICITRICQQFHFKLEPGQNLEPVASITLRADGPLNGKFLPRQQKNE